jgi:hypothetical protein
MLDGFNRRSQCHHQRLFAKFLSPQENLTNSGFTSVQKSDSASRKDYPNTYRATVSGDQEIERPEVFEPALKHFSNAFRLGDPRFQDSEIGLEWSNTRLQIMDHLLKMIADSRWNDHLVLRGSLLLKAWLGKAAREPGDIDWVFRPKSIGVGDQEARELFDHLTHIASENSCIGNAVINVSKISVDDIWTYERAPGRRIVFPWRATGLPPGDVQMDVVFGEELFADPLLTPIPLTKGGSALVWAASKELSLAWKLLWLETDMYPQGKDLYDATLLAEQTQLSYDLLYRVLQSGDYHPKTRLQSDFPLKWDVDWDNFKREYLEIEGTAKDWQTRLSHALAPTFTT